MSVHRLASSSPFGRAFRGTWISANRPNRRRRCLRSTCRFDRSRSAGSTPSIAACGSLPVGRRMRRRGIRRSSTAGCRLAPARPLGAAAQAAASSRRRRAKPNAILDLLQHSPPRRRLAAGAARRRAWVARRSAGRGRRNRRRLASSTLRCSQSAQEPMAVALDNDARLARAGRASRSGRSRAAIAAAPARPQRRRRNDRRRRRRPRARHAARRPGQPLRSAGADSRRNGHRQGARRPRDSQSQRAAQRAVHARQLRRDSARADRFATLRPRTRAASPGASETRQGWFERADMGTLFLDEIGELPLDAQVRFLRVLQDGFVERVGGAKPIRVNVRVVAATHRDLAAMVRESTFREDLWYRIAVFPILLPPLRDRVGRYPGAGEALRRSGRPSALAWRPSCRATPTSNCCKTYDWPGNIRELGAVIDRAAILGDGDSLELAAALGVAAPVGLRLAQPQRLNPARQPSGSGATRLRRSTTRCGAHIEAALRATHGRIEGPRGAARLLAINPHTLRARMRKLKIDWSAFRSRRWRCDGLAQRREFGDLRIRTWRMRP